MSLKRKGVVCVLCSLAWRSDSARSAIGTNWLGAPGWHTSRALPQKVYEQRQFVAKICQIQLQNLATVLNLRAYIEPDRKKKATLAQIPTLSG